MSLAALHTLSTGGFALTQTLAQSARVAQAQKEIWFWLVVLGGLFIAVVVVSLVIRKYFMGPIERAEGEAVFELSDLRRLHREGKLTDAEYQAARSAVIADGAGFLGKEPPPTTGLPDPERPPPDHPDYDLGPELLNPDPADDQGPASDNPPPGPDGDRPPSEA